MVRWKKTQYAYLFRLSNKFIQLCFKDRTELFIDTSRKFVIFVSKKGEATTYSMSEAQDGDHMELRKRFKYAHDVLTMKSSTSPRAGSTGRPIRSIATRTDSTKKLKVKRIKTNESRSHSPGDGAQE